MSHSFESFLDVRSDIQGRLTVGRDQDAGPIDPFVAKRLDGLKEVQGATFAGPSSWWGTCRDLEAIHQVERQYAERLPGTVGAVVSRGNGIEGAPPFRASP